MRSIRRKTEAVLSAALALTGGALLASGLLSCREPLAAPIPAAHQDDPTPQRGGWVRLASFGDIRSIDPAITGDGLGVPLDNLLFSGLVDFDAQAQVVADLASRWEVLEGGRLYRFTLREGVRFHDGEEVTADDVKRSVERALHPSTPNPTASFYEGIVGYAEYAKKKAESLEGVVVEGRYVVSFRLKEPDATFLPTLALTSLRPVCRSAGRRYTDGWHPCGAGPFRLPPDGWDRGVSVKVVRWDGYFRPGLPYLDGVQWIYSMNALTQRFKFEAGELDLLRDLNQADLVRFQSDARWRPFSDVAADDSISGEGMNTRMPPFDNVEVRRAVAKAIDREHYRLLKPGNLRTAGQLIPPDIPGYNRGVEEQRYDYAAALEHMRRAGYPFDPKTGVGGYPGRITYVAYQQGLAEFTAQVLQQELARIGLRIDIKLVSFPAYLALTHRPGKAHMSTQAWQKDYPDPSNFFEPLLASSAINEEDTNNTSYYSNARLDDLLARARHEIDRDARQRMYDEASRIVVDEAPWAFTHNYHYFEIRQPYLRGYRPHRAWTHHVNEAFLDRAGARLAAGPLGTGGAPFARALAMRERAAAGEAGRR